MDLLSEYFIMLIMTTSIIFLILVKVTHKLGFTFFIQLEYSVFKHNNTAIIT